MDKTKSVFVRHGIRYIAGIQRATQNIEASSESRALWQGCTYSGNRLVECSYGSRRDAGMAHGAGKADASRDYLERRSPEALQLDTIKGFRKVARANEVKSGNQY